MALRTHSTVSRERETKKWTWSTMDPILGPWTSTSWSTMSHAHAHSLEPSSYGAQMSHVDGLPARHVSRSAWPKSSPVQAHQSPVETQPGLPLTGQR